MVGKVLDAFQARVAELLAGTAARALSEDASLAVQMAAEPAAHQAGEPAAFYVGRTGDSVDHFVASILQSGFGSGGELAEIAVLQRVLKANSHPISSHAHPRGLLTNLALDLSLNMTTDIRTLVRILFAVTCVVPCFVSVSLSKLPCPP